MTWLSVTTTAPATALPITVAEARAQCRVDTSAEDDLLTGYVAAATAHIEGWAGLRIMTQSVAMRTADTASFWRLPVRPVQEVLGITYGGVDPVIVDPDAYELRQGLAPSLAAINGAWWPGLTFGQAFNVEAVVGYGDTPEAVPENIRLAVKMLVASFYETRGEISEGAERTMRALIAPYRLWLV